jgi:hypothetical protein
LVELRLDLLEDHVIALEDLGDVGAELPRNRIDDLVFLFDSQGEGGWFHESRC